MASIKIENGRVIFVKDGKEIDMGSDKQQVPNQYRKKYKMAKDVGADWLDVGGEDEDSYRLFYWSA